MSRLMAPIDAARSSLDTVLAEFDSFVQTCSDLTGDGSPPWVHLLLTYNQRLQDAADGYSSAVHRFARPVLSDIDRSRG